MVESANCSRFLDIHVSVIASKCEVYQQQPISCMWCECAQDRVIYKALYDEIILLNKYDCGFELNNSLLFLVNTQILHLISINVT